MTINQHWLTHATRVISPNYDERPDPLDISLIVIHCISLPQSQFGTPTSISYFAIHLILMTTLILKRSINSPYPPICSLKGTVTAYNMFHLINVPGTQANQLTKAESAAMIFLLG